jgi:hypothetical protein
MSLNAHDLRIHFESLSDESLSIERTSGNLVPSAQIVADEEFLRRQNSPKDADESPATKPKRGIGGLLWWEWIIIVMIIRAVFKFVL